MPCVIQHCCHNPGEGAVLEFNGLLLWIYIVLLFRGCCYHSVTFTLKQHTNDSLFICGVIIRVHIYGTKCWMGCLLLLVLRNRCLSYFWLFSPVMQSRPHNPRQRQRQRQRPLKPETETKTQYFSCRIFFYTKNIIFSLGISESTETFEPRDRDRDL